MSELYIITIIKIETLNYQLLSNKNFFPDTRRKTACMHRLAYADRTRKIEFLIKF